MHQGSLFEIVTPPPADDDELRVGDDVIVSDVRGARCSGRVSTIASRFVVVAYRELQRNGTYETKYMTTTLDHITRVTP